MTNRDELHRSDKNQPERLPYERPLLQREGDVRDLTLGGSPGVFDSINPGAFEPPVAIDSADAEK